MKAMIFASALALLAVSCTPTKSFDYVEPRVEYYPVASRQAPIEPVYSRVTWSHLPRPVGNKSAEKGELYQPVIEFSMKNATLLEALEALSQTIGYELRYPTQYGSRAVSMELTGTVEEVLKEVSRQAKVEARLDHRRKLLVVGDFADSPALPASRSFSQP